VGESDTNLRQSTLDTLAFLASSEQQRAFAAKVYYEDYVGEFTCWWFDSFLPDNALSRRRYSPKEFDALLAFSAVFERRIRALGQRSRSIDELLAEPAWQLVIRDAAATRESLDRA
jgi:hypothetical protein